MDLSKISSGNNVPEEVNVVVEIAQGSRAVKYEFDKESGFFCVDRFLPTAMYYPCNYGFIPHTVAGDGDPVDVLVVTRFPIITGAVLSVRPIGVLMMSDEGGEDVKVIAVPVSKVDPYYSDVRSYLDLPRSFTDSVEHFFSYYKKLEKDKFVVVEEWRDRVFAEQVIRDALLYVAGVQ